VQLGLGGRRRIRLSVERFALCLNVLSTYTHEYQTLAHSQSTPENACLPRFSLRLLFANSLFTLRAAVTATSASASILM
jgi:hypothetical protein